MIRLKHIVWSSVIVCIVIYILFSDADSYAWSGFYYIAKGVGFWYALRLLLKSRRELFESIIFKLLMGLCLLEVMIGVVAIASKTLFETINKSIEVGGLIGVCVVVFLIYKRYGLAKR